jgi:hypothetical protein
VAKVQPDEIERLQVADPLVELGRRLQIGEEEGESPHGQAFTGDDRLAGEQVEERLVREQLGAGQKRLHPQLVVFGEANDHQCIRLVGRVRELDLDRAGVDLRLEALAARACVLECERAGLARPRRADDQRRAVGEPQVAGLRRHREGFRRARLQVCARNGVRAEVLAKGRSVVHDAALREAIAEEVLLGSERPRVVVARPANLRGEAERDLDEVAQIGVAVGGADLAEVMSRGGGERRQALDDLTAAGADVLPFHRQQPELPGVEEELDDVGRREAVLLSEADGVDAHEVLVSRGADERVERVEQVVVAGDRGRELLEPVGEDAFVQG